MIRLRPRVFHGATLLRGMFSPRALIWSAIVIVVGVIIRFNAPPQNANHEQAGLDKDKPIAAFGDKATEKATNSNIEPSWQAPANMPKDLAPSNPRLLPSPRETPKKMPRTMIVANRWQNRRSPRLPIEAADKAAEATHDYDRLQARNGEPREFSKKAMSDASAKPGAMPEGIAKESPLEEAKAGPAALGMPRPLEKPGLETKPAGPAVASGEASAGNIAAHGGEMESQMRLTEREGIHSRAADGQARGEGLAAAKDAAEVVRGEGGGTGGRLAIQKKLDQSKAIAGNQPALAPAAPSPVAAPAAPMSAPAVAMPPSIAPPLSGQKAGATDVVDAKMGGGQTATVINLYCSAAAARDGTFGKLLSENGIAATVTLNNSLGNYGQQSLARYQNFGAENGSLSPGGVQTPLAGTASRGSTGRQQQVVQQASPNYNQAQREIAENSASRGSSQTPNAQPALSSSRGGAATNDNSLNNSLSGSNSSSEFQWPESQWSRHAKRRRPGRDGRQYGKRQQHDPAGWHGVPEQLLSARPGEIGRHIEPPRIAGQYIAADHLRDRRKSRAVGCVD